MVRWTEKDLQHLFQHSHTSGSMFQKALEHMDQQAQAVEYLQQSFQASEELVHDMGTMGYPVPTKLQMATQGLQHWMEAHPVASLCDYSAQTWKSILQQLSTYANLLTQVRRQLHNLAIDHYQRPLSWGTLKSLLFVDTVDSAGYRTFGIGFKFLDRLVGKLGWCVLLLLSLGLISYQSYNYFFMPYDIQGAIVVYEDSEDLDPSPMDLELFEKTPYLFNVQSQAGLQYLKIPIQLQSLQRLALAMELRPGRHFYLKQLTFLDANQKIVESIKFHGSPSGPELTAVHMNSKGHYELTEASTKAIEAIANDEILFWKLALKRGHPEPEDIVFSPKLIAQLETLIGQRFESKDAFNQGLKTLSPAPDWKQRAYIRDTAEVPLYAPVLLAKPQVLLSPATKAENVEWIELQFITE